MGRAAFAAELSAGWGDEEAIRPGSDGKTSEWIATLCAAGLDYRLTHDAGGWTIYVPAETSAVAKAEIEAYETDNRDWPPAPAPFAVAPPMGGETGHALWVCGFVAAFFLWLGPYRPEVPLLARAAADTERILAGDLWRVVTALTLHVSGSHLLGNLLSLFFLGQAVGKALGNGLGWVLILASGAAGNAAVAVVIKGDHTGVGASTSCFGALGIMATYQAVRTLRQTERLPGVWDRVWIPIGAGIGLLSILGTGPQSDLGAHGFGFVFGMLLALPFCWWRAVPCRLWVDRSLQLIGLGAVLWAWTC